MEVDLIETISNLLNGFQQKHSLEIPELLQMSEKLMAACHTVNRSWSGSFAGYHGSLYYKDFKEPPLKKRFSVEWGTLHGLPEGWKQCDNEEVKSEIERLTADGFHIDELESSVKKLLDEAEQLRREIVINFSVFNFATNFERERDIFTQIEKFQFGQRKEKYVKDGLPKSMMTRDRGALMQGMMIPSWLYYEGVAYEAKSVCEAVNEFLTLSDQLVRQIHMKRVAQTKIPLQSGRSQPPVSLPSGNRVFLVHGHEEAALHATARFLERLDLTVVVLREQPNEGRTIIEKFVDYSDVGFAIVLLTPDDRGGLATAPYEKQAPRARQNVIFELGYFLGKLGRNRVSALYRHGIEIPSDYSGILFVLLDDAGAWKLTLAREMKAAGLNIDLNMVV